MYEITLVVILIFIYKHVGSVLRICLEVIRVKYIYSLPI